MSGGAPISAEHTAVVCAHGAGPNGTGAAVQLHSAKTRRCCSPLVRASPAGDALTLKTSLAECAFTSVVSLVPKRILRQPIALPR
jgi:hypothetical protein